MHLLTGRGAALPSPAATPPALIFQQRKPMPPTTLLIKPKPSVFSLSNALRLAPWRWSKCYFSKFRLFNFNSLRRDEADHTKMMWERESEIERVCVTVYVCVCVLLSFLYTVSLIVSLPIMYSSFMSDSTFRLYSAWSILVIRVRWAVLAQGLICMWCAALVLKEPLELIVWSQRAQDQSIWYLREDKSRGGIKCPNLSGLYHCTKTVFDMKISWNIIRRFFC